MSENLKGAKSLVSLSPETVMVCAVLRDQCRSQHRVGKSWSRRWGSEGITPGIIWDTFMLSGRWRQDLNYGLTIDGLFESGFTQWLSLSLISFWGTIYLFITYRREAPQGNPNILMEIDIGPHTYLLLGRDLISDSLGGQSLFFPPCLQLFSTL